MGEAVASRRAVRAAARRRRARHGAAIFALSTIVVLGGIAAIVVTSPGWPAVRETFFSWKDFSRAFSDVLDGFWLDVKLFVVVEVVVLVLGLVVALCRISRIPAPPRCCRCACWRSSTPTSCAGSPTILLMFLVGFGIPALELSGLPTDPVILAAPRGVLLLRVRGGGLPGGDRVRAPEPAPGATQPGRCCSTRSPARSTPSWSARCWPPSGTSRRTA